MPLSSTLGYSRSTSTVEWGQNLGLVSRVEAEPLEEREQEHALGSSLLLSSTAKNYSESNLCQPLCVGGFLSI